jgi:hypothetical protein
LRSTPILLAALTGLAACSKGGGGAQQPPPKDPGFGQPGTLAAFDLDADLDGQASFYDLPYPSDLRLQDGKPRLGGFPNPRDLPLIDSFKGIAQQRLGFPVLPAAYFRFSGPMAPRQGTAEVAAAPDAPVLLIDVDPASPERGRLLPVVVAAPPPDDYVPRDLLAVAPRPGFVLAPGRTYAAVLRRSLGDAQGRPLGVPAALDRLRAGQAPDGALGAQALAVYAPLWPALDLAGIDPRDVAAATVFTTGDVVAETSALADALSARYQVSLDGLALLAGAPGSDRVCLLSATVRYPQFQVGVPPFDRDGLFAPGPDGLPLHQRDEDAPAVIAIPRAPMPQGGYPLLVYFHGSGGFSADLINMGPTLVAGGQPTRGRGPAWVHAASGVASAGSALPVNPERLPRAGDTAYLNLKNPAAMRDTFRQGVVEQRLFLDALLRLRLPPALLAGCDGPALPAGETTLHFDPAKVVAQGQSMGGMYTNLISATDARIRLAVPTGAGGFWTWFVLVTQLEPGLPDLLALLLGAQAPLTQLHPALHLIETGWEPADPFASMPRLSRLPLPGHPARPVYEPVGRGDQYFPTELYDAAALAYGHEQAGATVWPSMQQALLQESLAGLLPYPVRDNLASAGVRYTGAVVQYEGDGIEDPHAIYRQLDAVKHQYSCFVASFLATGHAVLSPPDALTAPCAN